jgi:hypothetical protein
MRVQSLRKEESSMLVCACACVCEREREREREREQREREQRERAEREMDREAHLWFFLPAYISISPEALPLCVCPSDMRKHLVSIPLFDLFRDQCQPNWLD